MVSINSKLDYGQQLNERIKLFGDKINNIVSKNDINYVIPLETKGALLVDVACDNNPLPAKVKIIYPRAIRYISSNEIAQTKILLVDDIFFSGRHLNEVHDQLISYGVNKKNIFCIAFLDFSSGRRDIDYVGFLHDQISKNIIGGFTLSRKETLRYLQKEMLEKTMPSVYDHLTIESSDVCDDKFNELLSKLSSLNRLLNYGQRGSYQACSILLDDIFQGDWDVPPKARLWWNKNTKKLRITPVGFYSCNTEQYKYCHDEFIEIIVNNVKTEDNRYIEEAKYEATILEGRVIQLQSLKKLLHDLDIVFKIDNNHLDRYYPDLDITTFLSKVISEFGLKELDVRTQSYEDQGYQNAINDVLKLIRGEWESQVATIPKDRISRGYSATEIFERLPKYNEIEIHSALDYCFDYHYIAVFRRKDTNGYSRCYRTTEIFDDFKPEEVYGAAIIYSMRSPVSEFIMNKIFAILKNTCPQVPFDSNICITKHFYGDIVRIKRSEGTYCLWKHIDTNLWKTAKKQGESISHFRKCPEQNVVDKVKLMMEDSRLSGFRDTLAAVTFLVENSGIQGALLLDILTPGYGGTDYIAHNLTEMLTHGSKINDEHAPKMVKANFDGADMKIKALLALYDDNDSVLNRLERQCTRLNMTYLLQAQAERIVSKARYNKSKLLYNALKTLNTNIYNTIKASDNDEQENVKLALQRIGVVLYKREIGLKKQIAVAADYINRTLYAIGVNLFDFGYYKQYTINKNDNMPFILGYDLTSERRSRITNAEELTRFDEIIHKFIANWIIAFNGKLSKSDINAGDLRFGFFPSTRNALSAACWIVHHLEQLRHTNGFPVGPESLGIVITSGSINVDTLGNASGEFLDMSGHFLKRKINNLDLLDHFTGKVGRKNTGFDQSQVWLLEHDAFEINKARLPIVKETIDVEHNGKRIQLTPVDFDEFVHRMKTPWLQLSVN